MRKLIQYALRLFSIAILKKYRPKVVSITGSVGKSSAKEAVFLVLDCTYPGKVRANERNLNTEIGVPITIIGGKEAKNSNILWLLNFLKAVSIILIKDKNYPEILVLEMAADRPGDIKYLTSFAYPDIAVVTAIGEMPVHLEFFPERDAYVGEKANIIKSLKPGGTAVLNYDDLSVREFRDRVPSGRSRIYYGFQEGADVRISDFSYNIPASCEEIEKSGMEFNVEYFGESTSSKITKTLGIPPLYAVMAGIAVGTAFGIKIEDSAKSLEKFSVPKNRLEILKGVKNTIIINDSYNSSPVACEAALDLLSKFKKQRKIAVLGSMRELGKNTEEAHRMIGKKSSKISDIVFLVGDETVFAKDEIGRASCRERV
jgi:UDP-N-acetylmuramyl pentapeptide synthase